MVDFFLKSALLIMRAHHFFQFIQREKHRLRKGANDLGLRYDILAIFPINIVS